MKVENIYNMFDVEELHLLLDSNVIKENDNRPASRNYHDTKERIMNGQKVIYTTIPQFLCFQYAKRLFVHVNNEIHEITLGSCDGTDKEIRSAHNLEKILFAGGFDWFTNE